LDIKSRLIGTGFIGGKTAGMLLARKMLYKSKRLDWQAIQEPHDSFYIGSDIFYSYIVENKWWKLRMMQKTEQGYLSSAEMLRDKMLHGVFSQDTMESFQQIVEYFGGSPIIVRSSSLLEDGFGNAFAGKYESIFLANQGSPEQRYIEFADAVRRVYASTMSEDALVYRKQRGLDKHDEQMALLIQRVSGAHRGDVFFPDMAGVGLSYNTYVWNEKITPEAGILRLVCGLGTRAVNRVDGDYPVMSALSEPLLRPLSDNQQHKKFSQHYIDVISIEQNQLITVPVADITENGFYPHITKFGERDYDSEKKAREMSLPEKEYWVITFKQVLEKEQFISSFKAILQELEQGYHYPVEIEFTLNFTEKDFFKINLLQCRPLQRYSIGKKVKMPNAVKHSNMLFSSKGSFIGGNIFEKLDKVIYIEPENYIKLRQSDKYDIARCVGKINNSIANRHKQTVFLIGPGRWGTSTPSLGISVNFSEINNMRGLIEVAFPQGHLMPELSFGTHFFQDLVETDIFYAALFTDKKEILFNPKWLEQFKNIYTDILPQADKYKDCIKVYDLRGAGVKILSDVISQKVICFRGEE
jgi:hypothetical protein